MIPNHTLLREEEDSLPEDPKELLQEMLLKDSLKASELQFTSLGFKNFSYGKKNKEKKKKC